MTAGGNVTGVIASLMSGSEKATRRCYDADKSRCQPALLGSAFAGLGCVATAEVRLFCPAALKFPGPGPSLHRPTLRIRRRRPWRRLRFRMIKL
jgi:hypothetical protein